MTQPTDAQVRLVVTANTLRRLLGARPEAAEAHSVGAYLRNPISRKLWDAAMLYVSDKTGTGSYRYEEPDRGTPEEVAERAFWGLVEDYLTAVFASNDTIGLDAHEEGREAYPAP